MIALVIHHEERTRGLAEERFELFAVGAGRLGVEDGQTGAEIGGLVGSDVHQHHCGAE
jgi:hypothetical protein